MNTRAVMFLAAGLYFTLPPQLQAESLAPQIEVQVEEESSLPPQVELLYEPPMPPPVRVLPEPGELEPNPTFIVSAIGNLVSRVMALSNGDLYLSPLESRNRPEAHPVPLAVTKRHQLRPGNQIALELSPSKPLIVGVSYELRANANLDTEFVDLIIEEPTRKAWKVEPPNKNSATTFPTAASPSLYNLNFSKGDYPQFYLSAILENVEAALSGFITLGMDGDGRLLSVNTSKWTWKLRTNLLVASKSCLLDDKGWTDLRSVEVILLGKRGERGELTIPVRVNPVVTSTFGALSRLYGKTRCKEDN